MVPVLIFPVYKPRNLQYVLYARHSYILSLTIFTNFILIYLNLIQHPRQLYCKFRHNDNNNDNNNDGDHKTIMVIRGDDDDPSNEVWDNNINKWPRNKVMIFGDFLSKKLFFEMEFFFNFCIYRLYSLSQLGYTKDILWNKFPKKWKRIKLQSKLQPKEKGYSNYFNTGTLNIIFYPECKCLIILGLETVSQEFNTLSWDLCTA